MRAESGFTLIEVLIATALFGAVALGAFEAMRELVDGSRHVAARHLAYASAERLAEALRAEARSATAIWSSAPAAGHAHDDCVQLDFFTADAAGPVFWSYRSFPNHTSSEAIPGDAVQRLAARAPIAPCDPARSGSVVLSGLVAPLAVGATAPAALAAHADAALGVPDSPFVAAGVPATPAVGLGVLDAGGAPVAGGNSVMEVRFDTHDASRVIDLLPGVAPNGFTDVLRYTCTQRCDVAHDAPSPKTLTACTMSWRTAWSAAVAWPDAVTNADGSLSFPRGWFIGGTFVFTYSGTRASDGGLDSVAPAYAATNWDTARNYTAFPPDRAAPDGSSAGSFAPWDVRAEAPDAWFTDFAPYLAAGERAPIAAEKARCDAVQAQGTSGGFYRNG